MPTRLLRDWTSSERVASLTPEGERLFTRLIMKADDWGRMEANPKLLRSTLFPLQDVGVESLSMWLQELNSKGLITLYAVDQKSYLQIERFGQRIRSERRFPDPPSNARSCAQMSADCGQLPDTCGQLGSAPNTNTNTHAPIHAPPSSGEGAGGGNGRGSHRTPRSIVPEQSKTYPVIAGAETKAYANTRPSDVPFHPDDDARQVDAFFEAESPMTRAIKNWQAAAGITRVGAIKSTLEKVTQLAQADECGPDAVMEALDWGTKDKAPYKALESKIRGLAAMAGRVDFKKGKEEPKDKRPMWVRLKEKGLLRE